MWCNKNIKNVIYIFIIFLHYFLIFTIIQLAWHQQFAEYTATNSKLNMPKTSKVKKKFSKKKTKTVNKPKASLLNTS